MTLKSIFFEEEDKPKPVVPQGRPAEQRSAVFQSQPAPPVYSANTTGPVYDTLKSKTDFATTDVGLALAKYTEPLRNVLTDEKARCKAAAALAAQEGVSKEKILATFDGLKVNLQTEIDRFNASAQSQEADSIVQKQNQIRDLSAQMANLQSQITQLSGEVSDSQAHITRVKGEFNNAVFRRQTELENEKKHYADLLQ